MYWGVYVNYNSISQKISVHKHRLIFHIFLCILNMLYTLFWHFIEKGDVFTADYTIEIND